MRKITKLETKNIELPKLKRVAAYARVSVERGRTLHSYSAQVSYYNDLIQKNPEWEFAGVYADLGISGTGIEKRNDFKRLLQDCEEGKIDPCCGSGGMFVQSMKFVESHNGSKKDVSVYGQEGTTTTFKLAKMNLAIRGISADLGAKADDTFFNDQHKDLKADFIMANPPFNQNSWRKENELVKDSRWLLLHILYLK